MQSGFPSSRAPLRIVLAAALVLLVAACSKSDTSNQPGGGLGSPPPTLSSIDQCAANGNVIVGSKSDGAKPGCARVNAAPSSATAQFGEIIVKSGGVLTLGPTPASGLQPLRVGDICLESGGSFIVGSAYEPQTAASAFKIIFTGNSSDTGSSDPVCQHFKKGIDVTSGATLELYGAKGVPASNGVSWTTLVKPAGPMTVGAAATSTGPTTLYLTADVTKGSEGWKPGDWIVVATTSFVPFDTEFVQIATVTSGSNGVNGASSKVTLAQPLKYYHFGSLAPSPATATCPDPLYPAHTATSTQPAFLCDGANRNYGVDERAEVGLISRDITLTAETATIIPPSSITNPDIAAATINEHWGGEIKIHAGFAKVAIQGVRLSKFGKAQLGSYPIHFHEVGDITAAPNPGTANVLVDADSVDHSYNKCVTIHDTSNLTISNMVCARIVGHIFYEELGDADANNVADDSGITFQDNLGLGAMSNSFDINPVTLASPSTTTYSRQQLMAEYWWTGDYMTNDPSSSAYISYDGFNIPDTDNWKQATYGSCASYQPNTGELGGFVPPNGVSTACNPPAVYIEPATGFWIQNPATNLIGDAIGGCQGVGTGFWWVQPQTPIKVNGNQVYLTYQRLGTVRGDRVHACYNGFGNDDSIGFVTSGLLTPQTSIAAPPSATAASLIATLDDVTATRNRFRGLWMRPTWYVVKNGHFATNRDNVSLLTSGGIDGNAPGVWELLEDSVLVGLSRNNVDRWGPCPARIALNPPEMHLGGSRGCIDYTPSSTPHSGEIYNEGYQTPFWNSAGYYLYDGPVRVFHDRFVNFNHNKGWTASMPCTGPGAGAYYRELDAADCAFLKHYEANQPSPTGLGPPTPYEGDAALGWFLSNQNSYPTGTASRQLSFVNTNLRHQVFTKQVNIGKFNDGDKNTSIIDEDGTLDGYGVQLAPNSGTHTVHPISLNNLPFNGTSNSVDECLSRGAQNQQFEGRTSALMSPDSMGTLQFSSLYPYLPGDGNSSYPGATNSHWQDVIFTRDDAVASAPPPSTATFHPTMVMQTGRGGLGSNEPKVSNGYGYTVRVSKTTAPGVPSNQNPNAAGLWKWIDVTLADIVDPNVSLAHPFYIRLGIDYKSTSQDGQTVNPPPPATSYFTIERGYKSYYGTISAIQNPELLKYWTSLPCQKLDAQNTANVPSSSNNFQGTCPSASGTNQVMALSSATSIEALTNADGTPSLDKYYYNPTTGYLYLNIVQDAPNPIGPSPVGSCDSAYDGGTPDPACPDTAAGETYYACPKKGCIDYTIAVKSDSNYTYTPGPSTGRPLAANLKPAPSVQNKLVLHGTNTVVTRQIALDDQSVPYYTATNAPAACTVTQPHP
ncbi:MAG: G8 domain-containing protein [Gammaproteobacteria bacterium]